jgi:triphosphoribosyl-dephospho-CoA synthase
MTPSADRVARAYVEACRAELAALKPGNVHVHSAGHGMTAADFEASARASAPAIADPALAVGARIFAAVERTRAVAAANTNLGILLLCAPLAQAALDAGGGDLRDRLRRVLAGLTVADAERAFAAIRLANPGGLGKSARHDVRRAPMVTLLEAMGEAAGRDRIAAQYAGGFADIFDFGLPRLAEGRRRWREPEWATVWLYLGFLARFPDSHIARKYGLPAAETVRTDAAPLERKFAAAADPAGLRPNLLAFDRDLKAQGLNPGTSADLTCATLFAADLLALEGQYRKGP